MFHNSEKIYNTNLKMDNLEIYVNISQAEFPFICRICLSKGELKPFEDTLLTLFSTLTNIKVESEGNLPDKVCLNCISKLRDISEFIESSKFNDAGLHRLIEVPEKSCIDKYKNLNDDDGFDDSRDFENVKMECQYEDSEGNNTSSISGKEDNFEANVLNDDNKASSTSGVKNFYCFHCDKMFPSKYKLRVHMAAHSDVEKFECKLCGKKFKFSQNLTRHTNSVHKNMKPFKCEICQKEFPTLPSRNKHKCDISESSCWPNQFQETEREVEGTEGDDDKILNKEIPAKTNNVSNAELKNNRIKCEFCQKTFSKKYHLENHKLIHSGEKPFECSQCGKFFRLKTTLNVHLKSHSGEKPYQCQICNKKFGHKETLRHHEKHVHRDVAGDVTKEVCNLCNKVLSSKKTLAVHLAGHYKRHQCSLCDNSYSTKSKLDDHIESHNTEELFECAICNKKISSKSALRQHLYLHSNIEKKQYQCTVCEKTFSKKFHLVNHSRVHSGEKPFECEFCEKTFRVKSSYKVHVRIHTGNKPYRCNFCEKRFAHITHWRYHEETHTLGKIAEQKLGFAVGDCDLEVKNNELKYEMVSEVVKKEADEIALFEPEYIYVKAEPALDVN